MNQFLSKDFLSGVMFIAFGVTALYFGNHLALGTPVRMGPGYVPHKLACIMLVLGGIIALVPLFETASRREKEAVWIPVAWRPSSSSRRSIFFRPCSERHRPGWLPCRPTGSS